MPMQYRSTNVVGYTHYGGALIIGVEQESGIELNPTSSGNAPRIMPCGDETNKGISLASKGTGTITIGSSANQPIVMTSTSITLGTSTSPFRGIEQYLIQFTPAVLAASTSVQSTITVTGLATNSALFFTPLTPGLSMQYAFRVQCSTASELRFTQQNIAASSIGTGESTARGLLLELKF